MVMTPSESTCSRQGNVGPSLMSSSTLGLPVRKTSGQGHTSSILSVGLIFARTASDFVRSVPLSNARSKLTRPGGLVSQPDAAAVRGQLGKDGRDRQSGD